ncbi:glycosyltransferase family 2 protein [Flavobacterium silvaticum]|uniref:Glycosyltransferase n=1 Tax=Flavobacterium silvaticum TaxID=1852020 RepID=A0A972FPL3_9FLAO|nr:glycosyltransferase family 2 protein [Flavobacterium silvaticum]NMH29507.1 glycosyltransferase [Flavobacterium silvaticum]
MKTITVFTPTYNRAHCLTILYDSLLRQTSDDFEWLVIDDGSVDETKQLVQGWIDEGRIPITYKYKENGGMHTGHNTAYAMISTELNVCIDSDDYLPDDGIEKMITLWRRDGSNKYAGMIGLDVTIKGAVIGTQFPEGLKECTYSELAPRYKVVADKKLVYRTEVVKKYEPYPVFPDERFVPLYFPIVIDRDYKVLCYNEVFCIVDYQPDGSTIGIFKSYFRNPKGFAHSRKIEMIYDPFWKRKVKSAMHYVANAIMTKNANFLSESPKKLLTFLSIPGGVALYLYLNRKKNQDRDISKGYKR